MGEPQAASWPGGTLTQMRDAIELVAKVRDLPDEIRVNVADLEIGDAIHIGDVKLPAGVRLPEDDGGLHRGDGGRPARDERGRAGDARPARTPTEPEIIGEKKEPETADATPEKKRSPNA